jgi:hypothetical protein
MTNRTGKITRGRTRPRTYTLVLFAVLAATLSALAGCGSSGSSGADSSHLTKLIAGSLQQHPGFAVRSVHCPSNFKTAKGVVVHCTATLKTGEVDRVRATQTDSHGTYDIVGSLIFADNVERAVQGNLPGSPTGAHVACPNRVPVVIGHTFTCQVSGAGSTAKALITIVDDDGGFRMSFS